MQPVGTYSKAIAAMVVATLTAYISALSDSLVTPVEWTVIGGTFVGSFALVWSVPNVPESVRAYGKAAASGAAAFLAALGVGLTDGVLTQPEVLTAVVALITGAGLTGIVPNAAQSDSTLTDSDMGWDEPDDQVPDMEDEPEGAVERGDVIDLNGQPGYGPNKP